jgi:hypothetical protein
MQFHSYMNSKRKKGEFGFKVYSSGSSSFELPQWGHLGGFLTALTIPPQFPHSHSLALMGCGLLAQSSGSGNAMTSRD